MKKLFLYMAFYISLFLAAFFITKLFIQDDMTNKAMLKAEEEANINNQKQKSTYQITIKNSYIIVYNQATEEIFEYTDIRSDIIRKTQPDIYMKLQNGIIFDSKDKVYTFLEGLAS